MLNDRLLRSAMASKMAYARTIENATTWPVSVRLHGNREKLAVPCQVGERGNCTEWIIDAEGTGAHAYAWKTGERSMLVSFKGSSTARDFASFLRLALRRFSFRDKTVKVHQGVLDMFASIEGSLYDHLVGGADGRRCKYVTFCGHSLGGSLAKVAAAYFGSLSNGNIKVSCFTFGSPKVGDRAFYEWLSTETDEEIHVVHQKDPVPLLPPGLGYYWNGKKTLIIENDDNRGCLGFLEAHDLDTYISEINKRLVAGE